jgi:hypothetical protein
MFQFREPTHPDLKNIIIVQYRIWNLKNRYSDFRRLETGVKRRVWKRCRKTLY